MKIQELVYLIIFLLVLFSSLNWAILGLSNKNLIESMFKNNYKIIYFIFGISSLILVYMELVLKKKKQEFVIIPKGGLPYVGGWDDKIARWFFR